jgi:hypothetical protein
MKLPIKVGITVRVRVMWRDHILGQIRTPGEELLLDKGEALALPSVEIIPDVAGVAGAVVDEADRAVKSPRRKKD